MGSAVGLLLAALVLTYSSSALPARADRPPRPGIRSDIAEGIRYLAGHRVLRTLALCVGLSNLASTAPFAVIPLFAVDPGHGAVGGRRHPAR